MAKIIARKKEYYGSYGDRDKHYVWINSSKDPYIIAYIRCDQYHGEIPEETYYKVSYVNEDQVLLGQEAVKKEITQLTFQMLIIYLTGMIKMISTKADHSFQYSDYQS